MSMPRILAMCGVLVLGACSKAGLVDLRSNSGGPDEFLVQPVRPLTAPADYASLPPPTPGGSNLTDPQPLQDAVVALGGRGDALVPAGVPAADAALVGQASRYGVQGDVRTALAAEDEAYRTRRGRLTQFRLFRTNRYEQVYRPQSLDPFAETQRFRRVGARTSSSPPAVD